MQKTNTWFDTARFGMFVHWSHCCQHGCELSWPLVGGVSGLPEAKRLTVAEYHSTAATFNPQDYDPVALAQLARRTGMQYAILTAKHHDGYAMYHTRQNDFSVEHSPYGKDITRMFLDAMRAEGLRVGLYFSLIDWHHPDYPAFTDDDRPYRWGEWRRSSAEAWARYQHFMFGQMRELLTDYGKIDILWFDCADDANFRGGWGDATTDVWRSQELVEWIQAAQPGILINNRGGLWGDFGTPEQTIPRTSQEGIFESCVTMTHTHWGYCPADPFKETWHLLSDLVACAARGGNYLLNVGPDPDGVIPLPACERLLEIGRWMEMHGEAIYGSQRILPDWWDHFSTGRITTRGNTAYLIIQLWSPTGSLSLNQLQNDVRRATLLATGQELEVRRVGRRLLIEGLPTLPPAMPFNVVKLELDGPATPQVYY